MSKVSTSSYIVTPPTVFIPRDGMSFCVLGRNKEWVDDAASFFDQAMPSTTITLYSNYGTEDDNNWAWQYQQMLVSDAIIIDCTSATIFDIMMALALSTNESNIWWIDSDSLSDNLYSLLNISGAKMADDIEEFFALLTHGM
jgi:hypothetical protein